MDETYERIFASMEAALTRLLQQVPSPKPVPFKAGFVFRCVEQTIQQAVVQKLARMITGLRAAYVLLKHGLVQEQAVMQRVLGDLQEDIIFLSYGIAFGKTELHEAFLKDFYQEDFQHPDKPVQSLQKRHTVPRKRIQAYLANIKEVGNNPSDNQAVSRTLHQAFSGFVHAASCHIMDMYGGTPAHFHVRGMLGSWRMREFEHDIWNYFERGLAGFACASMAFGDQELTATILAEQQDFHSRSGRND